MILTYKPRYSRVLLSLSLSLSLSPISFMAPICTTIATTATSATTQSKQKRAVCCFSYAAYAKNLIRRFRDCGVPVVAGLSDAEFASLESALHVTFPADLRSILREGLPVGPGFPNWRSSSLPQLRLLCSLPSLYVQRQVAAGAFWSYAWGPRSEDPDTALNQAQNLLNAAPALIPVYRHFYVPSTPDSTAGGPVFSARRGRFELAGFDVAGFFHYNKAFSLHAPAWAAKSARVVQFWTDLAEYGRRRVSGSVGWWGWDRLGCCMESVFWRLRDGGWGEEEVREMMMMGGGGDRCEEGMEAVVGCWRQTTSGAVGGVAACGGVSMCDVKQLSCKLLRAGWSADEVAYSLGINVNVVGGLCDSHVTTVYSPTNLIEPQRSSSVNPSYVKV